MVFLINRPRCTRSARFSGGKVDPRCFSLTYWVAPVVPVFLFFQFSDGTPVPSSACTWSTPWTTSEAPSGLRAARRSRSVRRIAVRKQSCSVVVRWRHLCTLIWVRCVGRRFRSVALSVRAKTAAFDFPRCVHRERTGSTHPSSDDRLETCVRKKVYGDDA